MLLLALTMPMVACDDADGPARGDALSDSASETEQAPAAFDEMLHDEAAPELLELAASGPQRVYVNFDGVRVQDCDNYCSNAATDQSFAIGAHWGVDAVDFGPYSGDTAARTRILDGLEAAFARYAVELVTSRPAEGPYTMLVVSEAEGPAAGVAPLDCENRNPSDIAFVYEAHKASIDWLIIAAAHELGHSFGLTHVVSDADTMHWLGLGDRFTLADFDDGHASAKCFEGQTQDGPAMLLAALGARQPDPPTWTGTFADDDGSPHEEAIEALVAAAVTQGCSGGAEPSFCPAVPVTRGQMVVFLQRALKLPPSASDAFSDDDDIWYEDAANATAAAGITNGCGGGRLCGEETVTRAQMAAFLARAFNLPAATRDYFDDDAGNPHEDDINRVAEAGITLGCGAGLYCPGADVSRAQMASFLARALGLS